MELLYIDPHDVVWDNPYFQEKTKRHRRCQIDYLIQTRDRTLYLCEIKFSQNLLTGEVVNQVEDKMKALQFPKGFSVRPILIHVNGISQAVKASEFFSKILDFSEVLQPPHRS